MDSFSISLFEERVFEYTDSQMNLLASIPAKIRSERLTIRRQISNKITSDEIHRAKSLFNDGETRIAGVLAGVALERHLLTLCESSNQELEFGYMDGIASLAQTLSNAGEISNDDQRLLEYLGGIRNNCSHANEGEPEPEEVDRLLTEAEQFIRDN
jgi:hypothetical protein